MKKKLKSAGIVLLFIFLAFIGAYLKCYGMGLPFKAPQSDNRLGADMEYVDYQIEGNVFTCLSGDARIVDYHVDRAYRYVYLEVHALSVPDTVQIYYATDGDFTPAQSVVQKLHDGKNLIVLPKTEYNQLRIDIGSREGMHFQINSIIYRNAVIIGEELFWAFLAFLAAEALLLVLYIKRNFIRENKKRLTVVVLCGLLYCLWAFVTPYNAAPDEYMRYDVPRYMFYHPGLPRGDEAELCSNPWGFSYALQPALSGMLSTFCMKFAFYNFGLTEEYLFIAARFASVICSCVTVWFLCKISERVFHKKYTFVVLAALLPQFAFISAYTNSDALALMATAIIFWYWILAIESSWSIRSCLGLAVGMSVLSLSYYNAYGYLPVSALLYTVCAVKAVKQSTDKKKAVLSYTGKAALMAGIVLVLAGWWFIRSALLHDGDFLGLATSRLLQEANAMEELKASNRPSLYAQGVSIKTMLLDMQWLRSSLRSFFGCFDYMLLNLPDWMYKLYYSICFMGGLGWLLGGRLAKDGEVHAVKNHKLIAMANILIMGITTLLSLLYSYCSDFQAQGRYLLPMLLPLMFLLTLGLEKWEYVLRQKCKINIPLQKTVAVIWAGSCVFALFCVVIPYYCW